VSEAPRIKVEELKKRMDAGEELTIVDVRNPQSWAESDTMIPEAVRIPRDSLDQNLARIPKSRPVVAYCT
jgi:adenylyltransferase/sulfurtransferase